MPIWKRYVQIEVEDEKADAGKVARRSFTDCYCSDSHVQNFGVAYALDFSFILPSQTVHGANNYEL